MKFMKCFSAFTAADPQRLAEGGLTWGVEGAGRGVEPGESMGRTDGNLMMDSM